MGKEPAPEALEGQAEQVDGTEFTLNEPASVTLTFAPGARRSKSVTVKLGGKAGRNSYKIKKLLKARKYTLTIGASNAGGRTKSKSIGLKIKGLGVGV